MITKRGSSKGLVARLLLALVVGGCAVSNSAGEQGEQQQAAPQKPILTALPGVPRGAKPVAWDNPIGGDPVSSAEEAASLLAFEPITPRNLGTPSKLLVNSAIPNQSARAIAFVYDTPEWGTVVVIQERIALSAADYDTDLANRVAEFATDPSAQGTARLVSLRDGAQGVLSLNADGTLLWVLWSEGEREVILRGEHLPPDAALALANGL
jgi:hypothetical protein